MKRKLSRSYGGTAIRAALRRNEALMAKAMDVKRQVAGMSKEDQLEAFAKLIPDTIEFEEMGMWLVAEELRKKIQGIRGRGLAKKNPDRI